MKRLLISGRSEAQNEPIEVWMYDEVPGQCRWTGIWLCMVFMLCCIASCSRPGYAYTTDQAVKCVVGEASNQGYTGMLAVSEVIRARGSLKGLYGCKASHAATEPRWVWKQARKAYIASASTNITRGANAFENVKAFGYPYWAASCTETVKIKDQSFFKCGGSV